MFNATTTTEALAPFQKVVKNLQSVIGVQKNRKESANMELTAAREHFMTVEQTKTAQIGAADAEAAKAERMLAKLEALLADD